VPSRIYGNEDDILHRGGHLHGPGRTTDCHSSSTGPVAWKHALTPSSRETGWQRCHDPQRRFTGSLGL